VGPRPVRLYAGEGIGQVLFFESDEPCEVSYADKKGKYQAQTHITLSKLG
jgi:dCTP deaminase